MKNIPFKEISFSKRNDYRGHIYKKNNKLDFKFHRIVNRGLNIFEQLQPSERQHSLILGTLLNPNEKHGFGDKFLKEFFDIVISDDNFNYNNEKWTITIEKNRFDICIKNKNNTKIAIIENKSNWADDKDNQLYRYWLKGIYYPQYRLDKHNIPNFAKIIYLSPSFEKQCTEQSITRPGISDNDLPIMVPKKIIKTVYFGEEIIKWLENCMTIAKVKEDIFFYIKQYRDYWR
jgi:hypothetical protein